MPIAYFSEVSYTGSPPTDFLEIAVDAGTDVSGWSVEIYNQAGDWLLSTNFPAPTTTFAGRDVYVVDTTLSVNTSVAILDDTGTVIQYLSFYDPPVTATSGPLVGETPVYAGTTSASGESIQSDDGGATYFRQTSPNSGAIPCYGPGMMVECPGAFRAVETLEAGDLVLTRDHGPQPVLWVSARNAVFSRPDFSDRPVLIPKGSLGAVRDLIVSPQHRLLIGGDRRNAAALPQALIPAKALIGRLGVRIMCGRTLMTWHHFALQHHEIVRVNGVWTESLLIGAMVLGGMSGNIRRKVGGLFQAAGADGVLNGPPARPCLSMRQAGSLLDRTTLSQQAN